MPTGVESGFPDFVVELWTGLFVPAGVPENVARRLAEEVKKATETEEFKRALRTGGTEMFYKEPTAAAAYVQAEQEKWTALIKAAKLGEN